ncbi:MAG: hypothetical protein GX964_10410, partial [Syntrophomonadaceae bacterium]|nr:hypothetical protein [Syntrophomonadaceae bacterium]
MRRARSKKLAIMILFTFMATLFAAVPMASASASYSVTSVSQVSAGEWQELGSVKVLFHMAELKDSQYLTLRLPSDFEFGLDGTDVAHDSGANYKIGNNDNVTLRIPAIKNALSSVEGDVYTQSFTVQELADNELKIAIENTKLYKDTKEKEGYFYIDFNNVYVDSGFSGDIDLVIDGQQGTVFGSGKLIIGTSGTGQVEISIDSEKTITTGDQTGIDNIRLKEDRPGAFKDEYIKLKLPNGFKWVKNSGDIEIVDGAKKVKVNNSYEEKAISRTDYELDYDGDDGRTLQITSNVESSKAAYIFIKNLKVEVDDETVAKLGEVKVTVRGTASSTPGEFIVAKYGEYGAKAYAVGDPTVVYAGRTGAVTDEYTEIGKFAIEEDVKASLIKGRTVTLQLVGGAKWVRESQDSKQEGYKYVKDIKIASADSKNYKEAFATNNWNIIGSARDIAKYTIDNTTTSACKAIFESAKISISADADEEIKLIVGGTAGVSGEFVVAEVKKPVEISVDGTVPNVIIGQQTVELPPIVVTETGAEAIDASDGTVEKWLYLEFPAGVLPTKPAKVEVTEGDLQIDEDSVAAKYASDNNAWQVRVKVKGTSANPSTIVFEGIKVTTDRTVPEGDLKVKVKGNAVVQNAGDKVVIDDGTDVVRETSDFSGSGTVTSATVANCVTPAPTDKKATAVFTIGETAYTLNGAEMTMDVA